MSHPGDAIAHQPTVLEVALAVADANLRDRYGPENSVQPWYMAPGGPTDHLYPNCPALQRSLRPGEQPVQGTGALYPEAGDVCGWCVRVWRARSQQTDEDSTPGCICTYGERCPNCRD